MKKAWKYIRILLNNLFRISVSIIVIIIFVGLSPIVGLVLVIGWLFDNWHKLQPDDFLKIGANHDNKESESD